MTNSGNTTTMSANPSNNDDNDDKNHCGNNCGCGHSGQEPQMVRTDGYVYDGMVRYKESAGEYMGLDWEYTEDILDNGAVEYSADDLAELEDRMSTYKIVWGVMTLFSGMWLVFWTFLIWTIIGLVGVGVSVVATLLCLVFCIQSWRLQKKASEVRP